MFYKHFDKIVLCQTKNAYQNMLHLKVFAKQNKFIIV